MQHTEHTVGNNDKFNRDGNELDFNVAFLALLHLCVIDTCQTYKTLPLDGVLQLFFFLLPQSLLYERQLYNMIRLC